MGRGNWEMANRLLQSNVEDYLWKRALFMAFDIPTATDPFEVRNRNLASLVLPQSSKAIDVIRCRSNSHLHSFLETILEHGSEGFMAARPGILFKQKF